MVKLITVGINRYSFTKLVSLLHFLPKSLNQFVEIQDGGVVRALAGEFSRNSKSKSENKTVQEKNSPVKLRVCVNSKLRKTIYSLCAGGVLKITKNMNFLSQLINNTSCFDHVSSSIDNGSSQIIFIKPEGRVYPCKKEYILQSKIYFLQTEIAQSMSDLKQQQQHQQRQQHYNNNNNKNESATKQQPKLNSLFLGSHYSVIFKLFALYSLITIKY